MPRKVYNKYRNKKVWSEEEKVTFDSIKERDRCIELRELEKEGKIIGLLLQPVFELMPAFRNLYKKAIRKIDYVSDFTYYETATGLTVVEDVKGVGYNKKTGKRNFSTQTADFKIKWKLVQFQHRDIDFRLIER